MLGVRSWMGLWIFSVHVRRHSESSKSEITTYELRKTFWAVKQSLWNRRRSAWSMACFYSPHERSWSNILWMHSAIRQRAHNRIQSDSFCQHAKGKREEEITSYHSTDMKHISFYLVNYWWSGCWHGGRDFGLWMFPQNNRVHGLYDEVLEMLILSISMWSLAMSRKWSSFTPFHHPFGVGKCPLPPLVI